MNTYENFTPGGLSLRPYGILTNEQLGYNRVNFNYNLIPNSVLSLERISFNTLSTIKSINPRAIVSIEKLGQSTLSLPIYSIRPYSLLSAQNITANIRLSSSKNILPYSITSIENIGQARFATVKSILAYSINSIEKLGHLSSLTVSTNILPYSLKSTETIYEICLLSIFSPKNIQNGAILGLYLILKSDSLIKLAINTAGQHSSDVNKLIFTVHSIEKARFSKFIGLGKKRLQNIEGIKEGQWYGNETISKVYLGNLSQMIHEINYFKPYRKKSGTPSLFFFIGYTCR